MSYAIAPTFEANKIGVRRVYTLAGLGSAASDIGDGMVAEGYNAVQIKMALDSGATAAQLQNLWDNYQPNTQEFGQAIVQLVASLSPSGSFIDTSLPQSVVSVINVAGQAFDLAREESWQAIANLFTTVQQQLNEIARMAPNDPDVISHVQQFNSLVVQWAGYYAKAFGSAPSPLPMASIPGGGSMSGTLGVIPLAVVALVAGGMVVLVSTLYAIYEWGTVKKAAIAAGAQTTQLANKSATDLAQNTATPLFQRADALDTQANTRPSSQSALAASEHAQAAELRRQAMAIIGTGISSTTQPGQPVAPLTNWFTQNWMYVAAVLVGMAILPPIIKKL